jgi:hypothetical protein
MGMRRTVEEVAVSEPRFQLLQKEVLLHAVRRMGLPAEPLY